jgi:hypothetical protein
VTELVAQDDDEQHGHPDERELGQMALAPGLLVDAQEHPQGDDDVQDVQLDLDAERPEQGDRPGHRIAHGTARPQRRRKSRRIGMLK